MYCLLKWTKFSVKKTKTLKNHWKIDIILEKSGNFVSPEKWEPCSCNCKPWFRGPCDNKTNVKHQTNLFQGFAVIMGPQIFPFTLAVRKGTEKIFLAVIFWTVFVYRFVMRVLFNIRMHSSRMRTVRRSGCPGGGCPGGVCPGVCVCVSGGGVSRRGFCPGYVSREGAVCVSREGGVQGVSATHTPPPVNKITDACENITFPQLLLRMVIKD